MAVVLEVCARGGAEARSWSGGWPGTCARLWQSWTALGLGQSKDETLPRRKGEEGIGRRPVLGMGRGAGQEKRGGACLWGSSGGDEAKAREEGGFYSGGGSSTAAMAMATTARPGLRRRRGDLVRRCGTCLDGRRRSARR